MFKAIATRGIKMNINVNTETNSHPLDRCSAVELEAAVALLKKSGNLSEEAFFVSGFADEPDKEVVLSFKVGTPFERVIRLIGHDPKQKQSFDARVSLTKNELAQFLWIEDGQAAVTGVDVIKSIKLLYWFQVENESERSAPIRQCDAGDADDNFRVVRHLGVQGRAGDELHQSRVFFNFTNT